MSGKGPAVKGPAVARADGAAERPPLEPVDPAYLRGLRNHVHDVLRRAIIAGDLPTATRLTERKLAEELGVSTTPLKEALRRLEAEGLVVTEPRRGIRVTFDAAQAEEMALARAALEGMMARMAAKRADMAGVAILKKAVAQMAAATRAGDTAQLIALNEDFHEAIHAISRCNYLRRVLAGQLFYDRALRTLILGDAAERGRALAEHRAILAAIEATDGEAAERTMRDHVLRSAGQHATLVFERRREASR